MTDQTDASKLWLFMTPGQRRKEVEQAIQEKNHTSFWLLLYAFLSIKRGENRPLSPHTIHTYRMGLQQFLRFLDVIEADLTQIPATQQYVNWLQEQKLAPTTVRNRATVAGHFIEALRWSGLEQRQASKPIKLPELSDRQPHRRPYTEAEVEALLRHADIEECLLLRLGLDAGFKAGEMVALRGQDVYLKGSNPTLVVRTLQKDIWLVPVSSELQQALHVWFRSYPALPSSQVLSGKKGEYIEDRLRRLCKRAKVEYSGASVEGLRLTAGARFHRKNKNVEDLMDFLRISHKRNIQHYLVAAQE